MPRPVLRIPLAAALFALSLLLVLLPRPAAALSPIGAPLALSDCATCYKDFPSVAGVASGRFLAVWQSANRLPPAHNAVRQRLFTPWGAPRTADLPLDRRAVEQFDAQVAAGREGTFVAVWSAVVGGESDVFAQRLSAAGAPLGAVVRVSADPP